MTPAPAALSTRPRLRLTTLCALYTAQGIPWGFITITLAAFLADQGLETAQVGDLLAFSTLPWAFKWIWGPLIDRFCFPSIGKRRPWIVGAQAMMGITVLSMILIEDLTKGVDTLIWMVFVHNCFNSLQDVATDALAVEILDDDEKGKANGYMWASKYLGIAIGGAGMGTVLAQAGLQAALLLQVAMIGLIMLFPLLIRERPEDNLWRFTSAKENRRDEGAEEKTSTRELLRNLKKAFSIKSTLAGAGFALVGLSVPNIFMTVAPVMFTNELGWTPEKYAQISGGPVIIAGLVGAVIGGIMVDRFGKKLMIAVGTLAVAGLLALFGGLSSLWESDTFVIGWMVIYTGLNALVQVGLFALFMNLSWSKVAATQFTTYMTFLNISMTFGQKLAGPIDEALSYPSLFLAVSIMHAATLIFLPAIKPEECTKFFSEAEDTGREMAKAPIS